MFLLAGEILPVRFMVSYEGFMAFLGGNFVLMFGLNLHHYQSCRDGLNLRLTRLWIGFLAVNIGYFVALFTGFAEPLYARYGIWFNANDTLHTLLILWAGQIFFSLRNALSNPPGGRKPRQEEQVAA
jgi:purine-cytosine permease-like protein